MLVVFHNLQIGRYWKNKAGEKYVKIWKKRAVFSAFLLYLCFKNEGFSVKFTVKVKKKSCFYVFFIMCKNAIRKWD